MSVRQAVESEAAFVAFDAGPTAARYVLRHLPPGGAPRALVVYVHPFGEEMNKSRRMAAWQARHLAASGAAVWQIDLLGCGDSAGTLGDATWAGWQADVDRCCDLALEHLRATWAHAAAPVCWLWGLRAGALLAGEVAARRPERWHLLLWQPQAGRAALQQFLRVKAMALDGGAGSLKQVREALQRDGVVDVAGYRLPLALAQGLENAALPAAGALAPGTQVAWFELSQRDDATLLPASQTLIDGWRAAGVTVQARVVGGPAFWNTVEIEDAPLLIDATTRAVLGAPTAAAGGHGDD
jgi:exosortase A-associated hydrolase 2